MKIQNKVERVIILITNFPVIKFLIICCDSVMFSTNWLRNFIYKKIFENFSNNLFEDKNRTTSITSTEKPIVTYRPRLK